MSQGVLDVIYPNNALTYTCIIAVCKLYIAYVKLYAHMKVVAVLVNMRITFVGNKI